MRSVGERAQEQVLILVSVSSFIPRGAYQHLAGDRGARDEGLGRHLLDVSGHVGERRAGRLRKLEEVQLVLGELWRACIGRRKVGDVGVVWADDVKEELAEEGEVALAHEGWCRAGELPDFVDRVCFHSMGSKSDCVAQIHQQAELIGEFHR